MSNTTSEVRSVGMRGQHRAEHARVHDRGRHRAGLVDGTASRRVAIVCCRRPYPTSRSGTTVPGARAGSAQVGRGWCGSSRCRGAAGRRCAAARSSAPVTAARVRWASRRSRSSTTLRDDRAGGLPWSARASRRFRRQQGADQVDVGLDRLQHLRLQQQPVRSSRSIASRCMTCTTVDGKYVRMSPSQRATRGADAPSPPRRARRPLPPASRVVQGGQRAVDRRVVAGQARRPCRPRPHRRAPAASGAAAHRPSVMRPLLRHVQPTDRQRSAAPARSRSRSSPAATPAGPGRCRRRTRSPMAAPLRRRRTRRTCGAAAAARR